MGLSDFAGKICPYCKCAFVPGDDIVVCSDCDMPHHRDCWVENQGCTTFGCQGTIKSADGAPSSVTAKELVFDDAPPAQTATVYCGKCGAPNSEASDYCVKCGNPLGTVAAQPGRPTDYSAQHYSGQQAESQYTAAYSQTTVIDQDIEQLVGTNAEYYIPQFRELQSQDKKTSWNWSAFLVAPYWLIYRKMYAYGAAALAGFLVLSLLGSTFTTLLALGGYVAFGVLGNYLYFDHLEKRAQQAKMMSEPYRFQFLAENAGVNTTAAVLAAVGCGLLAVIL